MLELCHCGHENTHVGRRCAKPIAGTDPQQICPCPNGHRVDIATFRVLYDANQNLVEMKTTVMRLMAVMETATGLQSAIIPNENGRSSHIEVAKAAPQPMLIVPR
jgi:hypothetical protein